MVQLGAVTIPVSTSRLTNQARARQFNIRPSCPISTYLLTTCIYSHSSCSDSSVKYPYIYSASLRRKTTNDITIVCLIGLIDLNQSMKTEYAPPPVESTIYIWQ